MTIAMNDLDRVDPAAVPLDYRQISVAVPTNGRPDSLQRCLASVRRQVSPDCRLIVLDSTPRDTDAAVLRRYGRVYEEFSDVDLLKYDENVPPGAARKLLAERAATAYVLFLDDDLEIQAGAFQRMFQGLVAGGFDIMSGAWFEGDYVRALGFLYTLVKAGDRKLVLKFPIDCDEVPPGSVVQFDDVQASMLVRRDLFERVSFDERFEFFFELFDFFFHCKREGIRVGAHQGALFHHRPLPYQSRSTRYFQNPDRDAQRFADKWGCVPVLVPPRQDEARGPLVKRLVSGARSRLARLTS